MITLQRMEDPAHPNIGALLATFPSGASKALSWQSQAPIRDSLAMGKELAARALQSCLDESRIDDADRTNWPSFTAAATRIVREWNAKLGDGVAEPQAASGEAPGE